MSDFLDIVVGDTVEWVFPIKRGKKWRNELTVSQVDGKNIICWMIQDCPRKLTFRRKTGIAVGGKEFGWLERKV
jgi:hypothetical protein